MFLKIKLKNHFLSFRALGGVLGALIILGIRRGAFSNEARNIFLYNGYMPHFSIHS